MHISDAFSNANKMPIVYMHGTVMQADSDYYTVPWLATMLACVIIITTVVFALRYLYQTRKQLDCMPCNTISQQQPAHAIPYMRSCQQLTGDSVLASAEWGGAGSQFVTTSDVNHYIASQMNVSNFFKSS